MKIEDVINIGTAETIDTLGVISNHTHTTMLLSKLQNDTLLHKVGILILINQHILEPLGIFLSNVIMLFEESPNKYK